MDKNTLIGLLLIGAIIIGFTIYNRPSQEQMAEQRRVQDSIAAVEAQRANIESQAKPADTVEATPQSDGVVSDFFGAAQPGNNAADSVAGVTSHDSIVVAANAQDVSERLIPLENDKVRLLLDTHGGDIYSVKLKDY
ncbi:MAG: hypothetical protein PHO94_09250, partial [Petrimonas sp.]|nr:hypothetical protein [Petrimonas sp.]